MRALHYSDWNQLEISNLAPPTAAGDEAVVRVAACGICGSEIESVLTRSSRRRPPIVMGHEFCGWIDDGSGRQVVPNAVIHCGDCPDCEAGRSNLCDRRQVFGMHRPGAFAEFVRAPASTFFDWPDGVPAEQACLAEPLANGVHVAQLCRPFGPRSAIVIGAGSIGLMCLQAIRDRFTGIRTVVSDVDPSRLDVAKRLGADAALQPSEMSRLQSVLGSSVADVVVDAAGVAATKRLSLDLCRAGGAAIWIGLGEDQTTFDTYPITLGERSILGSYAATPADMLAALELMREGRVDVSSWVTLYDPDDWLVGFRNQLEHTTRDVKAVLLN